MASLATFQLNYLNYLNLLRFIQVVDKLNEDVFVRMKYKVMAIHHIVVKSTSLTRMHSSRMRTGRSLTVCCSLLPGVGSGLWGRGGGGAWSRGGWCLIWGGLGGLPGPGGVCSWGGLVWGGGAWYQGGWVCLVGGCLPGLGGCLPGLGGGYIPACTEADTPPPCGQTDACENITLAQLRCGR